MKSERIVVAFGIFFITVAMVFSCFLRNAVDQGHRSPI